VRGDMLTARAGVAKIVAPRPADGRTVETRRALELAPRRRGVGVEHRLVQDLHQNRWTFVIEYALGQARDQRGTGIPAHHRDTAGIRVQTGSVLNGVAETRFDIVQCRGTRIFRREPLVDRYHQTAGHTGQLHAMRVIGVEVPGHEATAVGVHHQRCRGVGETSVET
jgi:hypothetical protein